MGMVNKDSSVRPMQDEARDLRLCADGRHDFEELSPTQQIAAIRAQHSLNVMDMRGHISLRECKRMFEFGAGTGGSGFVLAHLALINGGCVEVVEIESDRANDIVQSGILPAESVHTGDGVQRLQQLERVGKKFDLIAAFMFGPDLSGARITRLLPAAADALDDGGKLLVSSDPDTMQAARIVCAAKGMEFGDYSPPRRTYYLYKPDKVDTIVVPRANMPAGL